MDRERLTDIGRTELPLFRYSNHARSRMTERSIERAEVEKAIRIPLEVVPVRYGRSAASNRLSRGKYLVVIYERTQEDFIVLTAVKVDKAGARRYGFTRV